MKRILTLSVLGLTILPTYTNAAGFGDFIDRILPPPQEKLAEEKIARPEKPTEPRRPANVPGPKETKEMLSKVNAAPVAPAAPYVANTEPKLDNPPAEQELIPKSYVRTLYQQAELEDGRKVSIINNSKGHAQAHIESPSGRKLLVPTGHYELLEGKLYKLEPHNFALTNDTSILLSIYNGKVINYLPKWAVDNGEYTDF